MVRKIDHWLGRISEFLVVFSGWLILVMAFAQTYGVIMRYVFRSPDPASYELSQLFLLLCGVLAVAGVERLDQNVRNDIVSSHFPPRMNAILVETVFPVLSLVFVVVLAWKSMDDALYALSIGQHSQSPWELPLAPIKLSIPFGLLLLCLVLVSKVIHGIRSIKSGHRQKVENSGDTAMNDR